MDYNVHSFIYIVESQHETRNFTLEHRLMAKKVHISVMQFRVLNLSLSLVLYVRYSINVHV